MRFKPGQVRDGINAVLEDKGNDGASIEQIATALDSELDRAVPRSSIRSYLRINTPSKFERVARGHYRLTRP